MRLSRDTLGRLSPDVVQPRYAPAEQRVGMVHIGIGAFHRAHQAVYADDAMNAGDRDWRIRGVSLRNPDVQAELAPQDGLYTVTQRDAAGAASRLIGAVADVIVAPHDPAAVIAALSDPAMQVVTLTVTEKGYCQAAEGGLDLASADIRNDLAGASPVTIYGFLARALADRRARGLPGLTLLSCDNLAENGRKLSDLLSAFIENSDPALAEWTVAQCRFPSSMVDRIVPAPTAPLRDDLAARIGLDDAAAIFTEPFRQWVIEDSFAGRRPQWEAGGAEIVADVRPYEVAKLRMLNGAHSALAYLGLEQGLSFVHEAIQSTPIATVVDDLMRHEAATSFRAAPGQDLAAYATALQARFANPALEHRLAQIATDGSQKVAQRWLDTLAYHQANDRQCPAILRALAAWVRHVRGDGNQVNDPLAARLRALWDEAGQAGIVEALFGAAGLFRTHWIASPENRDMLAREIVAGAGGRQA